MRSAILIIAGVVVGPLLLACVTVATASIVGVEWSDAGREAAATACLIIGVAFGFATGAVAGEGVW